MNEITGERAPSVRRMDFRGLFAVDVLGFCGGERGFRGISSKCSSLAAARRSFLWLNSRSRKNQTYLKDAAYVVDLVFVCLDSVAD